MNVDGKQTAPKKAIRVFVVDDHPMIRSGVAAMLRPERGMQWVGEAGDGEEALSLAPALRPHVVLMDTGLPRMDGISALQALQPLLPDTRFVLLLSTTEPHGMRRALAAGAAGVLLKNATAADLVQAIRAAHERLPLPAPPSTGEGAEPIEAPSAVGSSLTQRERDLLVLMARGYSNQDICNALNIAMPTVKFHVTHILTKLHADNRTEAVLVALRHKLVELP
jgi:NarL family two-component system response regulator LiaR